MIGFCFKINSAKLGPIVCHLVYAFNVFLLNDITYDRLGFGTTHTSFCVLQEAFQGCDNTHYLHVVNVLPSV